MIRRYAKLRLLGTMFAIYGCIFGLFGLTTIANAQSDELWDAYKKCNATFGKSTWLCDANKRLEQETADQLSDLLWKFQTEIPCYCKYSKDCYRYGNVTIQSGVVAGMIIVDALPDNADATTKRIYEDAGLGTKNCSNGLLIVYAIKTNEIYTYRGRLTEENLSRTQAINAMNETVQSIAANNDVRYALPQLLRTYTTYLRGVPYRKQKSWEAIVGMIVAALICAIVAAFALAIFLASCCCKKERKKPSPFPPMALPATTPKSLTPAQRRQLKLMAASSAKKATGTKAKAGKKSGSSKPRSSSMPPPMAGPIPPIQPGQQEEPYYMVSEPPSTMYSTLPRSTMSRPYGTTMDPYGLAYPARVELYGTTPRLRTGAAYGSVIDPYGTTRGSALDPYGSGLDPFASVYWPYGAPGMYGPPAAQSSPMEDRHRRHTMPNVRPPMGLRQWPLHWERETQSKECLVANEQQQKQQQQETTSRIRNE